MIADELRKAAMTDNQLIQSINAEHLSEVLQTAGYRVNRSEQNGITQLLSASQGIGYAVRFGNPAEQAGSFVDFTFSCALRVQGELPPGLAETWNASRRFARMSVQGGFLIMEMDVVVAAGVSGQYLRSNLELWDRLLQEFIVYLRDFSKDAKPLAASPVAEPALSESEV
jgi:Putative bacterial sensory transduction regulator